MRSVSFLLLCCFVAAFGALAQQRTPAAKTAAAAKTTGHKLLMPQAYIGNSDYKGGPIKKDQLCNLLKQGITSRDSSGKKYKVSGFEFAYSERMVYEDSLGSLIWVNDYMSEYCPGDTLSHGIASSIYERIKVGDTLYINRVSVLKPTAGNEENKIAGLGLKCVIIK